MSDDASGRATGQWVGVAAAALCMVGVAVVVRQPGLLLAGTLAGAYAGYAGLARPPRLRTDDGPAVRVDRRLGDPSPDPGDEVTVTVAVRNAGSAVLPDVRVVDGVPPELDVVEGSPRLGTALRPGAGATFSYVVNAARGEHEWGPATVVAADPSGAAERETTVGAPTTLRCAPPLLAAEDLPLRGLTSPYAGRLATDAGGAGVEFYATREYRHGDPRKRIDWRRLARTGDLATREFREERAVTVVLLVDARYAAYRAPDPAAPNAVERSVDAAGQAFSALLDHGDRVGLYGFGQRRDGERQRVRVEGGGALLTRHGHEEVWLPPGADRDHRARARMLLATHPALSASPPDGDLYRTFRPERREELRRRRVRTLRRRLPADAQVFVFSPCCDDYMPGVARTLDAHGHLVTVVSPDPTADDTPGRRLARMEREDRLRALRAAELRVVDFGRDESFAVALARARARWST